MANLHVNDVVKRVEKEFSTYGPVILENRDDLIKAVKSLGCEVEVVFLKRHHDFDDDDCYDGGSAKVEVWPKGKVERCGVPYCSLKLYFAAA